MVLYAIKENFRCAEAFLLRTGRIFLLFSSKIETSCQQNKQSSEKLEIPCCTKFLRVLIFAIFPAIRKNEFPQKKIDAKIFPAKIYSRVNILWQKFATQKYSTKGLFIWRWGTPGKWSNPLRCLRWGKKITLLYMQSYIPAIPGCTFSRLLNGRYARKQEKCWQTTCFCCNLQCHGFLLLPFIMMQSHRQSEFDVSRIRSRLGG